MVQLLRSAAYLSLFLLMLSWEHKAPRRPPSKSPKSKQARKKRWFTNAFLTVANALCLQLLFKSAAVGVARRNQRNKRGLLHRVPLPAPVKFIVSVSLLDLLIYGQHRVSHTQPLFWRLHRVHHCDPEVDVSTAARFHPLEAILSMLLKMCAVRILGAGPRAVVSFELLLNLGATFNHSNIKIRPRHEKILRYFVITPDLHRIHHSIRRDEQHCNYGFSVSWWDLLFASYRGRATLPQNKLRLGDRQVQEQAQSLKHLLFQLPLRSRAA